MQDSHKSLYAALYEAVGDMKNPVKNETADALKFKYKYATLEQVVGIIRPALRAHGCDFLQRVSMRGEGQTLETVIFNVESDMVVDVRPLITNADPQKAGSYETYMRRYALMTVFGLAGEEEDDDGAKAAGGRQRPAQARQDAKRANTTPKKKEPPIDEVTVLTKKLKEVILDSEGGNKEKAREKFREIMKPEGAKASAAYIRQQLRLFENGPVVRD